MPNSSQNPFFDSDEASESGENISALGFHEDAGENEEEDLFDLSDNKESTQAKAEDENDFDLEENADTEISEPAFAVPRTSSLLSQVEETIKEALANEAEDEDEDEADDDEIELEGDDEEESLEDGESGNESTFDKTIVNKEEFEDEEDDSSGEEAVVSKAKIILARKFLNNIQENIEQFSSLLGGLLDDGDEERIGLASIEENLSTEDEGGGRIVEGVFNGENMIGPDGHEYAVPANYASKSKLVEGDMLKLTITGNGIFRYKQTKPVDRNRIIGKLEKDQNGNYFVNVDKRKFRVITASITYYKGMPGDKVVILVPISSDSAWAAVENVIKSK